MPYSVEYLPEDNIIYTQFTGKVDLTQLHEGGAEIIRVALRENCQRTLTDFREADLTVSVLQIFNLPGELVEMAKAAGINIHTVKRAVVSAKDRTGLEFYETVSRNRGHHTKLFLDFEEAKQWLKG
ncbi:MAG: hypothetical protein IPO22_23105 [Anaerolineales bacterium]|nr:hypothetical protein [Anaerolineales bacterium]